jgi:hypothetical protein
MVFAVAAGVLALIAELAVQAGLFEAPTVSVAEIVVPLLFAAVGTRLFLMFARLAGDRGRSPTVSPFSCGGSPPTSTIRVEQLTRTRRGSSPSASASASLPTCTTTSAPSC